MSLVQPENLTIANNQQSNNVNESVEQEQNLEDEAESEENLVEGTIVNNIRGFDYNEPEDEDNDEDDENEVIFERDNAGEDDDDTAVSLASTQMHEE